MLFAGAASPSEQGASLLILRLAEITLIEAHTCEQVIVECERNLASKLPHALPAFRYLVSRCLKICPDSAASALLPSQGLADQRGLPVLVAAIQAGCPWLVTFNHRHFVPGHPAVEILKPGDFIRHVRDQLSVLVQSPKNNP